MKSLICLSLFAVISTTEALAQPSVAKNGVLNVASYAPVGLPNSSIAQGSMFVVFGSNIGPATLQQVNSFPLPTTAGLAGTSVKVTVGGTTVTAIMIYTSAGQVAAVLPSNTPTGAGTLTVTFNGQTSAGVAVQIVPNSFGIFTVNQAGTGPGIITDPNYSVYSLSRSAHPNDVSIVWGTGLGPVQGNEAAGALPGDMPNNPVEVYVGLTKASISYRGRSGCCTGLDQIAFTIPNVLGCHVPVAIKIGNVVSNFVTMPIAAPGASACSDPSTPTTIDFSNITGTFSSGGVSLNRTTSAGLPPPLGTGADTTSESGSAGFSKYTVQQLNSSINALQAFTFGACTVFTYKGSSGVLTDPIRPTILDAGAAITVTGPKGAKQLTKQNGVYFATLGGGTQPLYLDPGSYTISGPGGADVGPFTKNVTIFQALSWTNKASISDITRANGVDVTWTGGDPNGTVQISGGSTFIGESLDPSDAVGASFTCTERTSAGHFAVPALVLLLLPPSTITIQGFTISTGSLSLGNVTTDTFTASGLDYGAITSSSGEGKIVNYK